MTYCKQSCEHRSVHCSVVGGSDGLTATPCPSRDDGYTNDGPLVAWTMLPFLKINFYWSIVNLQCCNCFFYTGKWGFPGGLVVKNPPANAGDVSLIPGGEVPLETKMATYSGIFPWEIPWTEEPGMLQTIGSKRVEHD